MSSFVSLKLALFNNTFRRVGISAEVTLNELWVVVQKLFLPVQVSPQAYSLHYSDEDGDKILLSTEEELKEALRLAKASPSAKFQVSVVIKKQVASFYEPKTADAGLPWPTQIREKPVAIGKARFTQHARLLESHFGQQALRNNGKQLGVQPAYITLTEARGYGPTAASAPQTNFKRNARLLETHFGQQAHRNNGKQLGVQSAYITLTEARGCSPTAATTPKTDFKRKARLLESHFGQQAHRNSGKQLGVQSAYITLTEARGYGPTAASAPQTNFKRNARRLQSHFVQQQALADRYRGKQLGVQSAYITLTEARGCSPTAAPAPLAPQVAAAVATAPVAQPPTLFIESLKALEAMGFADLRHNIETLIATRGNLNGAVALLLQQN